MAPITEEKFDSYIFVYKKKERLSRQTTYAKMPDPRPMLLLFFILGQ